LLADHTTALLTEFVQLLLEDGHVDLKSLYIDGTKIEFSANRYTFVWRKAVEKNQKKLMDKMIQALGLPDGSALDEVEDFVKAKFNEARNLCSKNKIVFVHGIGHRKTQDQRDYEDLKEAMDRFGVYRNHLALMGIRNSYSKTDHDAAFMRMKEDHMLNGQLKLVYNLQLASSGAFIVDVMGSQKANDLHALKPFLEQMLPVYGKCIEDILADAGYESAENYDYLKLKNLTAYIKPANYETKKKRKTKEDIGSRENMLYLEDQDVYVCKAGKHLARGKDWKKITASGFQDTIRTYTCYECENCPHASACIKARKNANPSQKSIKFSPAFEQHRMKSEQNLLTDVGIDHRINRSIQAEGAFSKLKDGLGYTRFRHRSMKKVVSDIVLVALGINLNKLHNKILCNQTGVISYKKRRKPASPIELARLICHALKSVLEKLRLRYVRF